MGKWQFLKLCLNVPWVWLWTGGRHCFKSLWCMILQPSRSSSSWKTSQLMCTHVVFQWKSWKCPSQYKARKTFKSSTVALVYHFILITRYQSLRVSSVCWNQLNHETTRGHTDVSSSNVMRPTLEKGTETILPIEIHFSTLMETWGAMGIIRGLAKKSVQRF